MNRHSEPEYRRYTAVLREDNRSFAISPTRRPRGTALIEINGNDGTLKCSVKNLMLPRVTAAAAGYDLWLINEEDRKKFPVFAGSITINERGVGESTWGFNADSIKQAGLDMDAAVSLEIRSGFPGKDPGERVLVGHLELEEVNLPEEPKMEKVSPFGVGLPFYQWWKFYPGYISGLMGDPSVPGKVPAQVPEGVTANSSGRAYGGFLNSTQPIPQACSGKFTDFQTRPVFQGHQLIGLQYDNGGAVKYLVHGIPGRFCLRDQPYGGTTGYIYWHPLPGQQYKAGDYGYWLVHIDPKTGEVVFPQRATKPPDCERCNRND